MSDQTTPDPDAIDTKVGEFADRLAQDPPPAATATDEDDDDTFHFVVEFETGPQSTTTLLLPDNHEPDITYDDEARAFQVHVDGELEALIPGRRLIACFRLHCSGDAWDDDDGNGGGGDGPNDDGPDDDGPNLDGLAVQVDGDGVVSLVSGRDSRIFGRRDELAARRAA